MAFFRCLVLLGLAQYATCAIEPNYPCPSPIYCHGDLLQNVQMSKLYKDSKTFVDMKLKYEPNVVLENYRKYKNETKIPNKETLQKFVNDNFDDVNTEFEVVVPGDWVDSPQFLQNIKDPQLREWAHSLNAIWKELGRKIKDEVKENNELYSIVYVKNMVIVPGGRFREFYYWDSYWIMSGLLLSEMHETVRGMLDNFAYIVDRYGLIPNGGRIYYLERSQPPLFIPMVKQYYDYTGDIEFVKGLLNSMEKEYKYWTDHHLKEVTVKGKTYKVAYYGDRSLGPRPESYREDYENAKVFSNNDEKEAYYSELKAAAESGWDFSSRWFIEDKTNKGSLSSIKTRSIMPVDLNAILYWNAEILSEIFKLLGNKEKEMHYKLEAENWLEIVNEVFWHDDLGIWLDYDVENGIRRNYFYPSNIVPLWTGCYNKEDDKVIRLVMKYLQNENAIDSGGVPTSFEQTGEQWDFPNAWPPLQHIIVVGLNNTGDPHAQRLAYEIAKRWVISNYKVFDSTSAMFEKYDAEVSGGYGGGGEYDVQLGFGWSNGVIMDFLHRYGETLTLDSFEHMNHIQNDEYNIPPASKHSKSESNVQISTVLLAVIISLFAGFIGIVIYKKRNSPDLLKNGKGRPSGWQYTELKNIPRNTR